MPSSRLVPRLSDRTLPTSLTPSKCCEISSSKGVCTHPKTPCSIPILSVSPRSAMSSIRYTRPLRHVVLRSFLFCLRMDFIAIECGSRGGEELFKELTKCLVSLRAECDQERVHAVVRQTCVDLQTLFCEDLGSSRANFTLEIVVFTICALLRWLLIPGASVVPLTD